MWNLLNKATQNTLSNLRGYVQTSQFVDRSVTLTFKLKKLINIIFIYYIHQTMQTMACLAKVIHSRCFLWHAPNICRSSKQWIQWLTKVNENFQKAFIHKFFYIYYLHYSQFLLFIYLSRFPTGMYYET